MFTDWEYSPSFVAPNGQNGDENLLYPGVDGGPVSSVRLQNIRDGIEDWELFSRLGHSGVTAAEPLISNAADLIRQAVLNDTARREDPALLERLRREAARRVIRGTNT